MCCFMLRKMLNELSAKEVWASKPCKARIYITSRKTTKQQRLNKKHLKESCSIVLYCSLSGDMQLAKKGLTSEI